MSYCVCGGYLGSGGADGIAGVRWCRCAQPKMVDLKPITFIQDLTPTPIHIDCEPSEDQKRVEQLETLLQEITKELLEFSSNGKIENIRSRIREVLGE